MDPPEALQLRMGADIQSQLMKWLSRCECECDVGGEKQSDTIRNPPVFGIQAPVTLEVFSDVAIGPGVERWRLLYG